MPTATKRKPKLKVYTEAHRNFIHLPTNRAQSVRDYLRKHGYSTLNPEPVTPGIESIELPARADLKVIQRLLDEWTKI